MKRRANTVNAVGDDDESKKSRMKTTNDLLDKEDAGHRRGNFHNYYSFHPSSLRMKNLKAILEYIGKHSFTTDNVLQYCDLGCNEGDLTIKIASALQQQLKQPMHFVGIDMDPVLIERAKTKEIANESVTGDFYVENICEHKSMLEQRVDVTSLLSTTMWIHIHAGDEGLKSVLEKICERTKQYILIEPQPSKCYHKAQKRLRQMGRPEIDVSIERLKLRQNIEDEIKNFLWQRGFQRVSLSMNKKTEWNRELQLYERK